MNLQVIKETVAVLCKKPRVSEEEQVFIMEFAFKTKDKELTNKLIAELTVEEKDVVAIMEKYKTMFDRKSQWIGQVENLLVALERYRIEEEKAMNRLADILQAYGMDISSYEIRTTEIKELKTRIKKEVSL
jgi:uncharacterized protein involved in exopolysaccharide biosynthesis